MEQYGETYNGNARGDPTFKYHSYPYLNTIYVFAAKYSTSKPLGPLRCVTVT